MLKKKIALMVYPYFSLQEIANLCNLFKWHYDTETVVFSSTLDEVNSEEGILVKPEKTFAEFKIDKYDCLILSGCSDLRKGLNDHQIKNFLMQFKNEKDFIIGAICAGPIFLSQAGLLDDKKFTNSVYVEMNNMFKFVNNKNIKYAPLVESGNIVTAVGSAFTEFAIAIAKKLGYKCSDKVYGRIPEEWKEEDYKFYLKKEGLQEFKKAFSDFIN